MNLEKVRPPYNRQSGWTVASECFGQPIDLLVAYAMTSSQGELDLLLDYLCKHRQAILNLQRLHLTMLEFRTVAYERSPRRMEQPVVQRS